MNFVIGFIILYILISFVLIVSGNRLIEQTDNEIVYERKKMNRKIRRTVRLVIITLGTCLSVFLLAVAVLINFILHRRN